MVHTQTPNKNTSFIWRLSVIILQIVAFWRVWLWYFHRGRESPEDLLGMVILAATAILLCPQVRKKQIAHVPLISSILLVSLYITVYAFVPPLVRAAIAVAALGTTLHLLYFGKLPQLSVWGLFLLALPIVPTMQFYLGYPARIVASVLTIPLLRLGGFSVKAEGTALVWNNQMIQFDAPCSGVKMLWAGLFVTLVLTAYYRFGVFRLAASIMMCLVAVLFGNVLRASSLFYIETGVIESSSWWHTGIGVVVFGFTATAIAYMVQWIRRWNLKHSC